MLLPVEIRNAKVLITVKTYPLPSSTYGELVCTAGLLDGERWIRIYPIPYRFLEDNQQYPKYSWVTMDLTRNQKDFRPESYRPLKGVDETILVGERIGTSNGWAARKRLVLQEVYTSMGELISRAKGPEKSSLATLHPSEIVDFVVEEDEREWKAEWLQQLRQLNMFDPQSIAGQTRQVIPKLPYKFSYRLLTAGDNFPRKMMIEDWEIGALYWNCLVRNDGDEAAAIAQVRSKYFDEFLGKRDLYLFVGTTLKYHSVSPNPFVIIGVFYPPKTDQLALL